MNIYNIYSLPKRKFLTSLKETVNRENKEGDIVVGKVTKILNKSVLIDVGLRTDGEISKDDFRELIKKDYTTKVCIEKFQNKDGYTQLNKKKVYKEEAWEEFERCSISGDGVKGVIIGKVNKGGFAVNMKGVLAFLPGSQVDTRPIEDISPLINKTYFFKILKIDKKQGNLVVSRRGMLEKLRKEAKKMFFSNIKEGMVFRGIVKNITSYGAFIDLGDIDGLLHVTDISWKKILHPSEKLALGQRVKVIVIKYDDKIRRISLGIKQLSRNPWNEIEKRYIVGAVYRVRILNISEYGVFVKLENLIEGFVYLNEVSWDARNIHPKKILKEGEEVRAIVLSIHASKRRINLSIKRCTPNPWGQFIKGYPAGNKVKIKIRKIVNFGIFANIRAKKILRNSDFLIPGTEICWKKRPKNILKNVKINNITQGVILNSDRNKKRIIVSIKKLKIIHHNIVMQKVVKENTLFCKIIGKVQGGIYVKIIKANIVGFIKKKNLSKYFERRAIENFSVYRTIKAKTISYERKRKIIYLSKDCLRI